MRRIEVAGEMVPLNAVEELVGTLWPGRGHAVIAVPGVSGATVKIVFDPPWDQSRMSDEARLSIGMF